MHRLFSGSPAGGHPVSWFDLRRGAGERPARRPRVTWLIPLFWFFQAVMRVRHSPLFAITAVLALAEMFLTPAWPPGWHGRVATCSGSDLWIGEAARRIDWRPALLPAGVILLAAVLQAAGVRRRSWAGVG